jgi:hypothetical protein
MNSNCSMQHQRLSVCSNCQEALMESLSGSTDCCCDLMRPGHSNSKLTSDILYERPALKTNGLIERPPSKIGDISFVVGLY